MRLPIPAPLFLSLLLPDPEQGLAIEKQDLPVLWDLARKHNLSALLYTQMERRLAARNSAIEDFLLEKKQEFLSIVVRSVALEAVEAKVVSLLQEGGVESCLFKGRAIAEQIYGDPNCRYSSDIDILIRQDDVLKADAILSAADYRRDNDLPLLFWMERIHHAVYLEPLSGHTIEVHWNFGIPSFFRLTSEEIWDGIIGGPGEHRLGPEMNLIQALMHHHMHAFKELRPLVDIIWLMNHFKNNIDWSRLSELICKIGLVKTTLITMRQIRDLWGEEHKVLKNLEAFEIGMKNNVTGQSTYLGRFLQIDIDMAPTGLVWKDKVMMRLALDRPLTIAASFAKILFPKPEAIKALYNDQRKWVLPFHYIRFLTFRLRQQMDQSNKQ
jgi:hypothetical protein